MRWLRWAAIAAIVISLVMIARQLPVGQAVEAMKGWIEGLGVLGPVVFGAIYVVATVLLLPASAFTIAAGIIFGLLWGTITVSISATTAAAVAFLIARYAARDRVAAMARKNPRFDAIDAAIGEGGWKIVALLRLSPAVPFNLQNYLYGLTAIRFWPCVLTSWVAMLPGTFMYVYLGYAGRAGLAAAGSGGGRTTGEWALLILGLLATIVVTVYVTRLAQAALQKQTRLQAAADRSAAESGTVDRKARPAAGPSTAGTAGLVLTAALVVAGAAMLGRNPGALAGLFGPPRVASQEAYAGRSGSVVFDHSALTSLLASHVREGGWVDYAALASDAASLDAYIASLADAPLDSMGRDERLALLINAYNAFTLRLILDHREGGELESIKDIPASERWEAERWRLGGRTWSLDGIEHQEIRPNFREPRVHFALVCAAVGCPPLRREAYAGALLENQLTDQARYVHGDARWFDLSADGSALRLTELYKWFAGDFEQVAGSTLAFAARYAPRLQERLNAGAPPRIEWIDYDWRLNTTANEHLVR